MANILIFFLLQKFNNLIPSLPVEPIIKIFETYQVNIKIVVKKNIILIYLIFVMIMENIRKFTYFLYKEKISPKIEIDNNR